MYGQGQGRQAVAVACVASPKKPALHLLHCGPSVLCWQFCRKAEGVAQLLQQRTGMDHPLGSLEVTGFGVPPQLSNQGVQLCPFPAGRGRIISWRQLVLQMSPKSGFPSLESGCFLPICTHQYYCPVGPISFP